MVILYLPYKHSIRIPAEGLGLNTLFFQQLEYRHDHLVDRVSPFLYPPKQLIHPQTNKDGYHDSVSLN